MSSWIFWISQRTTILSVTWAGHSWTFKEKKSQQRVCVWGGGLSNWCLCWHLVLWNCSPSFPIAKATIILLVFLCMGRLQIYSKEVLKAKCHFEVNWVFSNFCLRFEASPGYRVHPHIPSSENLQKRKTNSLQFLKSAPHPFCFLGLGHMFKNALNWYSWTWRSHWTAATRY